MTPILYIVIPCYNEEEVLPITCKLFLEKIEELIQLGMVDKKSRILFVNDGSKDKTWEIICALANENEKFIGISQSRNRGHQNAVLAGLMEAKDLCDITISIDCDGQDDINAMNQMVEEYQKGCEVVYGIRSKRDTDTFFKRFTAEGFYKILNWMGAEVVFNHADYRATSKRVLEYLETYEEVNLFLRGIFPLIGFKSDIVYYERNERFAGESKYPLKKMLSFAWDGITSFSVKPIKMVLNLGIFIFFISIFILLYCLIVKLLGNTVPGWTFTTCSIWLVAGLEMLSLGLIGEYIGKIYRETKARPRFIISRNLEEEKKKVRQS